MNVKAFYTQVTFYVGFLCKYTRQFDVSTEIETQNILPIYERAI